MSARKLWYGYLEAGEKSSPVLRDSGMETNNKDTIYLFNLLKGAILEYKQDIVEPKLRILINEEKEFIPKLVSNYKKAKKEFIPRGGFVKTKAAEPITSSVAKDAALEFDVI